MSFNDFNESDEEHKEVNQEGNQEGNLRTAKDETDNTTINQDEPIDRVDTDELILISDEPKTYTYEPESKKDLIKTVLFNPRLAIRYLTSDYDKHLPFALVYILGIIGVLDETTNDPYHLAFPLILVILVLGIVSGYIEVYVSAFFIGLFGKIFKGKASYEDLRIAVLWSNLPIILIFPLTIVTFVLGSINFAPYFYQNYGLLVFYMILAGIALIAYIWAFINQVKMISQLQKFSAFKAFITTIFPILIVLGVGIIIVSIITLLEFI